LTIHRYKTLIPNLKDNVRHTASVYRRGFA
jgi:hypothetical protein